MAIGSNKGGWSEAKEAGAGSKSLEGRERTGSRREEFGLTVLAGGLVRGRRGGCKKHNSDWARTRRVTMRRRRGWRGVWVEVDRRGTPDNRCWRVRHWARPNSWLLNNRLGGTGLSNWASR